MALGRRRRQLAPPRLIMTSMVDIFTFLLIFLLASFSDHVARFAIPPDVGLPKSTAKTDFTEHVRIVASQNTIWLNSEPVGQIKDGKVAGLDEGSPQSSVLFRKLVECREQAERTKKPEENDHLVLFLCDRNLPFRTINSIIKTAGMAGFPNFQFGVLKK